MAYLRASISEELAEYVDNMIDNTVILNRTDAIRQIIIEHRDKISKVSK